MKAIKNATQELTAAQISYYAQMFLFMYSKSFRIYRLQEIEYENSLKFKIEWINVNDALPSNFSENYLVIKNDMIGISDFTDAETITYWAKMPTKPIAKPSF